MKLRSRRSQQHAEEVRTRLATGAQASQAACWLKSRRPTAFRVLSFHFYVHMFFLLFRLFFLVSSSKVLLDNIVLILVFFHISRAMVVSFYFFSLPLFSSVNGKVVLTVYGHINN